MLFFLLSKLSKINLDMQKKEKEKKKGGLRLVV